MFCSLYKARFLYLNRDKISRFRMVANKRRYYLAVAHRLNARVTRSRNAIHAKTFYNKLSTNQKDNSWEDVKQLVNFVQKAISDVNIENRLEHGDKTRGNIFSGAK